MHTERRLHPNIFAKQNTHLRFGSKEKKHWRISSDTGARCFKPSRMHINRVWHTVRPHVHRMANWTQNANRQIVTHTHNTQQYNNPNVVSEHSRVLFPTLPLVPQWKRCVPFSLLFHASFPPPSVCPCNIRMNCLETQGSL